MRARFSLFLTVPVFATVLALACSNQSEGQPCDPNNGNNDCNSNLICRTPPNPNATNAPDVCCPQDLSQATTSECTAANNLQDASPAPPDGQTAEAASDAPVEAGDGAIEAGEAGEASASDSGEAGASEGGGSEAGAEGGQDSSSDGSKDASGDGKKKD
jgi:hypothetical protein